MTVRSAILVAALGVAAGCATPPVDVAFGGSDTVVVNGSDPASIVLEARDASGAESVLKKARFSWVSGDRLWLSKEGIVACDRVGAMRFDVSVRGFSKRMTLLCRPIRGFANPRSVRLVAGGAGEDLPINPMSLDGGLEGQFRARITLADTTVAAMRNGKVFPRKPGATYADAQVGDCVLRIGVVVIGRAASLEAIRPYEVFSTDVVLGGSTPATWQIPVGRYRFYPTGPARASGSGLNCASIANGVSCVSKRGATFSLTGESPGWGAVRAHLVVERLADVSPEVHSGARHVSGGSAANDRCVNYMGGFASR